MKICGKMIGATAVFALAAAATASPFSQLKFDINGMAIGFTDGPNGTGNAVSTISSGGGNNFTGSWGMNFGAAAFLDNKVRGNNLTGGNGPFVVAGSATLVSVDGFLNFNNGDLVDGTFKFGVTNNGAGVDYVQGSFSNSGTSFITGGGAGPWNVSGLVINSVFVDNDNDANYGLDVDISLFVNQVFGGSFAEFFLADNGSNGDFDMIVEVPAPGSAVLGLAAAGLLASRRRRS